MVLSTAIVKMSAIVIIITVEVAVKWSSQAIVKMSAIVIIITVEVAVKWSSQPLL